MGIHFITVVISIRFDCCLQILLFVFIFSELACNFVSQESMNGFERW